MQGPAVRGYRTERAGTATRLVVTLDGDLKSSTELRFLAHAPVPSEGDWTIPALRPLNADLDRWNDDRDPRRVPRPGRVPGKSRSADLRRDRRIPVRSIGLISSRNLRSRSPSSSFASPERNRQCEVRGQLFVGGSPCRLECQLNWTFQHGSMSELEIDLSPAWLPDRVLIRGLDDPVAWHPSVLPSGSTRLHVALPATALAQNELVLSVGASSTVSGGRGPLELPRVRPVGTRIIDEAWVAWVDQGTMIQPTVARGLAWIDPGEVSGLRTPRGGGSDLRRGPGLALDRRPRRGARRSRTDRARAHGLRPGSCTDRSHGPAVSPSTAVCVVNAGALSLDSVPIWVNRPGRLARVLALSRRSRQRRARPRPIDEPARSRLGFPKEGSARSLVVKVASQTEKTIHFHAEYPWSSHGSIPLVAVSRKYLFRGTIVVETPAGMQSRVKNTGLRRLDPSAGDQPSSSPTLTRGEYPGTTGRCHK